jgi:hypothetical protein
VSPGDRKPGKTGATSKRGKAVNIHLRDADQVRIRALAAYLVNEGLRVSDSQIIKAALLLAQPEGILPHDEHVGLADRVGLIVEFLPVHREAGMRMCSAKYSPATESMPPVPAVGS